MNDQLSDFIHFMTVERGLSENTIVSYKRDLQNYLSFLMTHGLTDRYKRCHAPAYHSLFKTAKRGREIEQNVSTASLLDPFLPPISAPGKSDNR